MTTTYKSLKIVTTKQGRDYVWKIINPIEENGDSFGDSESGEEFRSEEEAIEDAKMYIDAYHSN